MAELSRLAKSLKSPFQWIVVGLILLFFAWIATAPTNTFKLTWEHVHAQYAQTIGMAMHQYALDHDGKYPTGKSSTEVFKKLMDGKYVTDPTLFYGGSLGRDNPASHTLTQEYVHWDVTVPVDINSPDGLPIVFSTGSRVSYEPGGSATAIKETSINLGIVVCYKDNSTYFKRVESGNMIRNFIGPKLDVSGKKYVQLTPDGPLP